MNYVFKEFSGFPEFGRIFQERRRVPADFGDEGEIVRFWEKSRILGNIREGEHFKAWGD